MISPRLFKTWAILLTAVFIVASTLFAFLGTPIAITGGVPLAGWLDPVIAGATLAIATSPLAFVLCAISPGAKVGQSFDESKCPGCDYDLTGLDSDRCPECGTPIDPTLSETRQDRE